EVPADRGTDAMLPFHEYVAAPAEGREGRTPFIWALGNDRRLRRLAVAEEMVGLAAERLQFWSELRQLAGQEIPPAVRQAVAGELEGEYEKKADALRAEYEARLAELKASYPGRMARRLAEGLLRTSGGSAAVAELLASLPAAAAAPSNGQPAPAMAPVAAIPAASAAPPAEAATAAAAAPATAAVAVEEEESLSLEASIESARCTSCNECTNLNNRMFGYNPDKQAYVKDVSKGTFQQLVLAAERCPVSIIHPGTPRDPKEKDLAKWVKRAERFN
ncbi:MAG TPA: ferredoxin, partial [Gemmatimonadales bacterium]|nr:ferredoxin [Gemmatimonadales bacterium]